MNIDLERDSILISGIPPTDRYVEFYVEDFPDKSLTHRAIILGAMAFGRSLIKNPLLGDDCLRTKKAFSQLGVKFTVSNGLDAPTQLAIESPGKEQWVSTNETIDLGNSGTSARLLTGLFSSIPNLKVHLTGDMSLSKRPMQRVVDPLRQMGAQIDGPTKGQTLPLTITGTMLCAMTHHLTTASAQIKSAILLAASGVDGTTSIDLPTGSRDHTEKMIKSLGGSMTSSWVGGREQITFKGPWRPTPFTFQVPNDPSSLAFFAAIAAIVGNVKICADKVLKNKTRIGFFETLSKMGVSVEWTNVSNDSIYLGETVGSVSFFRSSDTALSSVDVLPSEIVSMIDEIPILSVVCACAVGKSVIHGLGELRVKESDRFAQIMNLLQGASVTIEAAGDQISIEGSSSVSGFKFASEDHRMVMSAMILGLVATGDSEISGISWIKTSFPLFLEAFQNINFKLKAHG